MSRPSSSRWRVRPEGERIVAAWDLERGAVAGELVGRNRGREVRLLRGTGRPTAWVKRFEESGAADREAGLLDELLRRGVPVPRVVASGPDVDGRALLVLADLPGDAFDRLFAADLLTPAARRARITALACALRRMHDGGVAHRQLFAWHVLFSPAGEPGFLDVAAARVRGRAIGRKGRARDLAALFVTLSRRTLALSERARLLASYEPDRATRRALLPWIRREQLRLRRRARVPRDWDHREWRERDYRLQVGTETAAALERAGPVGPVGPGGPVGIDRWLTPPEATVVRVRDGRTNLRWDRPIAGTAPVPWFGKRYDHAPWFGRAPAFREIVGHRVLASIGIPVPAVVAVGRREGGASVLWTRGVQPGTTLRAALRDPGSMTPAQQHLLLVRAAAMARRLHAAGFCHRDLYLDHFLLEESAGALDLVLIDLGRLEEHAVLPRRRRIKDLAALEVSARDAGVRRTERWRALNAYVGHAHGAARKLAPSILRKADRIEARERRHGRLPSRAAQD